MTPYEHIKGCLISAAVGDAIGLPREGLGRRRARRLFGTRPLGHALIARRGLCSDDTEHTVMVAQALIASGGDPQSFQHDFARRLRWWVLRIPASVGWGTLRACLRLWCGFPPERSGVRSAGNGPAMRSALLGLVARTDEHLAELVHRSTQLTHTDPRAEQGAHVIAALAHEIAATDCRMLNADEVTSRLIPLVTDEDLKKNLILAINAAKRGLLPEAFADELGFSIGVSGFVVHTVPAAVYCWFAYQQDFQKAVEAAIDLGGDSDTLAAIVGSLTGTQVGRVGIPQAWIAGLAEWPCTVEWMDLLAQAVAGSISDGRPNTPPKLPPMFLLARNFVFIFIVLAHGFRRLLPPY